jgi:hypothetical protein
MGTTPRSIQSLLHTATPDIADLIGRARFLERMRQSILEILPEAAAPHVHVAAYEGYRLRLHVTHGGWATRLRYMQPAIVQALAQRMRLNIEGVDIKVRPDPTPAAPPAVARVISERTRAHLRQTAHYIGDRDLATALERLAAAGRRSEA